MTSAAETTPDATKDAATFQVDAWTDLIGRLVERHPRFWIAVGNWETRLLTDRIAGQRITQPVYVAGLARSGSTILLELLAQHPDLASHRYRDFPGVLAPWAWNWFLDHAASQAPAAQERAHRDRIKVTPQSPEAFEEVIWMAFFPFLHDPAASSVLDQNTANPDFEPFYRDHLRKLLLLRGRKRYLAKGNYNITRLAYLLKLFPDARFVVLVRDPAWHIASLMKQHALFSKGETEDPRVLDHMRRAGHFEFGRDRRAVNTGDAETAARVLELWQSGREVEGWADYWSSIYGHLAQALETDSALRSATCVVRYEDLCRDPAQVLARILTHCRLAEGDLPQTAQRTISAPDYYRPAFTPEEQALIRERTHKTAQRFGYA